MTIKEKFIDILSEKLPFFRTQKLNEIINDNLLSPHIVKLPKSVIHRVQNFSDLIWKLRNSRAYQNALEDEHRKYKITTPGNNSILMSFDFHYIPTDNSLKLIEINTNASFLALGHFMNLAHGVDHSQFGYSVENLKDHVLSELKLFGNKTTHPRIAIADEEPQEQKLYIEFLVFNELFKSWGFDSQIIDIHQLESKFDFIYNRSTDFYFRTTPYAEIRDQYNNKDFCFSPNPEEYFYLADKERLNLWSQEEFLESIGLSKEDSANIRSFLPYSQILTSSNKDEVWNHRKNLFFKPLNSFGSKQSYKGAKISRKIFDEMENFIAQEYIPPHEVFYKVDEIDVSYKCDLRFFFYQNKIDGAVARLYQGQVTNLKTPGGGFAPIQFV